MIVVSRHNQERLMAPCRLLLLGPPQIEKEGQVTTIALKKAVALAAFLAVEQRAFSREYLASLLWPDHGQAGALANLRRTLTVLRETLTGCIVSDANLIQLSCSAVTADVNEFHLLCQPSANSKLQRLVDAATLYRGDFLEGFNLGNCLEFDEWQDAVRGRLRSELDDVLERLAAGFLKAGDYSRAIPVARRRIDLDDLNEAAHRQLIESYALLGRVDLAHEQFKTCMKILEREGLEPDESTVQLHTRIVRHQPPAPAEVEPRTLPKRRKRWIAFAIAALVVSLAIAQVYFLRYRIFGSNQDLGIVGLQVIRNIDNLAAIRVALENRGALGIRKVNLLLTFSADGSIRIQRDYMVYAETFRFRPNGRLTLEVDADRILAYVLDNAVDTAPGVYTVRASVYPNGEIRERLELNNSLGNDERFFFHGSPAAVFFDVDVAYAGTDPLDAANPLRIYIGDITQSSGPDDWGQFCVYREGRYFFPLASIPRRDNDGSGYFLIVVYDSGANIQPPFFNDPGDWSGIYKEVIDGLVYGSFHIESGTPIYPENRYDFKFAKPELPVPDLFEEDDEPFAGTMINVAELPFRQFHTFHIEDEIHPDSDWFTIPLAPGESFTAETYSAGGRWEARTHFDLHDTNFAYLGSGRRKSIRVDYAVVTHLNDTGIDQTMHLAISSYDMPGTTISQKAGEYIVEFRR